MKANSKHIMKDNKASAPIAMIGIVIGLAVSIIIGVLVFYKINGSLTMSARYGASGTVYNNSRTAINNSAQTTYTLLPIIAIILIASFMIAIVTRFGSGM